MLDRTTERKEQMFVKASLKKLFMTRRRGE